MKSVTAILFLAIIVVFTGGTANADGPTPGGSFSTGSNKGTDKVVIDVVSSPQGVTIFIEERGSTAGQAARPGTQQTIQGPTGPVCTATPMNIGSSIAGWVQEGRSQHPDTLPWYVTCQNGYGGVAWVPVNAPGAPDIVIGSPGSEGIDPVSLAASVWGIVPLPPVAVGVNPDVGLVAVPGWFWVEGYDGRPLRGSRSLGLTTVEVELTPSSYRWFFGDGASLETQSLGQPYPAASDVQHTYEQSSRASGAFRVRLEITFNARYRVNGGPWQALAPASRSFERSYPVQQLQSVLTTGG